MRHETLGQRENQTRHCHRCGDPFQGQRLLHHRLPQRKLQGSSQERIPAGAQPSTNSGLDDSPLIELDPNILAVTCERIKQALLRELTLADLWRGRVYVQINSALSSNQAPLVFAMPYLNGWQYQVELAR